MKFIWIDDNKDRQGEAENLSANLKVEVDFINVDNTRIEDKLVELVKQDMPDLIIMDHSLDRTISETYRTGSTAATFLREHWKNCPIVSCTGVEFSDIDNRHKSAYEGIYPINRISENYESIHSVALGFQVLRRCYPKEISDLFKLFNCPEEECERLHKILPKRIKENFNDKSLLLEIYRWCNTIFFERPGFLYDELWSATYLGLSQEGFSLIKHQFDSAKYDGIFKDGTRTRWWKNKLLEILSELVDEIGLPWVVGRNLVEKNEKYYSTCFASGEDYPEIVAAEDTTPGANWYPMKLKNTEPHPNYEEMLFFDELRMMKSE